MKDYSEYFIDVVYLVEANDYEQFCIWREFHYKPNVGMLYVKEWKEINAGKHVRIGYIDNRPIALNINYAILNGKKIAFYYGCSQLVDHKMIEIWLDNFALNIKKCDAMNFGNCLRDLNIKDIK